MLLPPQEQSTSEDFFFFSDADERTSALGALRSNGVWAVYNAVSSFEMPIIRISGSLMSHKKAKLSQWEPT